MKISELLSLRKEVLKLLYEEAKGDTDTTVPLELLRGRLKLDEETMELVCRSLNDNALIRLSRGNETARLSPFGMKQLGHAKA